MTACSSTSVIPQAHEDDAERAVRAGLEFTATVGDLKPNAPLQTRVGIATGLVVVGDLIGSGAAQDPWRATIVGLGRVDKLNPDLDAGKQHEGGEALDQLVVAGGDTA